ncbi:MAG: phosphopantetheine-binding protein [Candidatus Marinarcus sp.]|uniref:phosphopantetheine-binding protein n=1 Tax=Candidatus Marinarcus sp. TaxID=3100987 RepID=UPI003AFF6FD8
MSISNNEFKQILIDGLKLEDMSVDDISDSDALFGDEGLGLDSVDSIELVLIIEKEYGVKINNPEKYDEIFASVDNLLKYINENIK